MSPTHRSLKQLQRDCYAAQVVEKGNPFAKVRQDLFGVDLLALKAGEPLLIIQCTNGSSHAARRTKLTASGYAVMEKGCGCTVEVWSWAKQSARGGRKTWTLRREQL